MLDLSYAYSLSARELVRLRCQLRDSLSQAPVEKKTFSHREDARFEERHLFFCNVSFLRSCSVTYVHRAATRRILTGTQTGTLFKYFNRRRVFLVKLFLSPLGSPRKWRKRVFLYRRRVCSGNLTDFFQQGRKTFLLGIHVYPKR